MAFEVHPVTPERWADLEAVFNARGCSVARGCWCMYYRVSGATPPLSPGLSRAALNRDALRALVDDGAQPPGLIGYRDGAPIGWVSLGPREDFTKLARSPVMKPVDERPVWSIVCFVVPSEHRGQGVARALLDACTAYAAARGANLLEAYPLDKPAYSQQDSLWFGTKSMFDDAGYAEVARRSPTRPVMRLAIAPAITPAITPARR